MSSLNLNKVVLCGRLTATPELQQTPSGISVCNFSIAVNRRFAKENEQKADFINIIAWRQTAEFITKYFDKGNSICITGSIQTRSWKDSKGENRYATDIVADEAMFVDSKNDAGSHDAPTFASQAQTAPKFEDLKTDDDLPF